MYITGFDDVDVLVIEYSTEQEFDHTRFRCNSMNLLKSLHELLIVHITDGCELSVVTFTSLVISCL